MNRLVKLLGSSEWQWGDKPLARRSYVYLRTTLFMGQFVSMDYSVSIKYCVYLKAILFMSYSWCLWTTLSKNYSVYLKIDL